MRRRALDALAAALWLFLALVFLDRARGEPALAGRLLAWGLALQNGLLTVFFVLRRQAKRTAGAGGFLLALAVTAASWFFRPAPLGTKSLGLALELIALPWLIASLLSLGPALGMAPADRGLRTGGMYQIVRHPLYAGELLVALGYVVGNPSLANGLLWLLILAGQLLRIRREERLLSEQYPDAYTAYRRRVRWRLLPFLF